jgi:sarcosine oxidase
LVITAGAWANKLLDVLKPGLAVPERQVLAWLQPTQPDLFALGALPVWILDAPEGVFYGFPVYGIPGFKFGRMHHREQRVDPDTIDRTPDAADEALLRGFAARYFPGGAGPTMTLKACMFTNTPDEHFILDRHPEYPQVVFGAGFSGHGYKFCPVIGEALADLAIDGRSPHPVEWLGVGRFAD